MAHSTLHPNRDVWFTSDTHFGHENIIHYAGRPFEDAAEMDEALIEAWNARVKPEDLVWHLGDFAMPNGAAKAARKRLNGTIRLIVGNHDNIPRLAHAGLFQAIRESYSLGALDPRLDGVVATHRPIVLGDTSRVNVHGHIHHRPTDSPRHVNVCVEATGYAPIHFEELLARVEAARAGSEGATP